MTLTSQTLGDLLPVTVVAEDEEKTVEETLLGNLQFTELPNSLFARLEGATEPEDQKQLNETFCAMCFPIGWYARDLGRMEMRPSGCHE